MSLVSFNYILDWVCLKATKDNIIKASFLCSDIFERGIPSTSEVVTETEVNPTNSNNSFKDFAQCKNLN